MKVLVSTGEPDIGAQMCGYAEYKIFSALAPYSRDIDTVRVQLARDPFSRGAVTVRCEARLAAEGRPIVVAARGRGTGVSSAIDRAAVRIAQDVARHADSAGMTVGSGAGILADGTTGSTHG